MAAYEDELYNDLARICCYQIKSFKYDLNYYDWKWTQLFTIESNFGKDTSS